MRTLIILTVVLFAAAAFAGEDRYGNPIYDDSYYGNPVYNDLPSRYDKYLDRTDPRSNNRYGYGTHQDDCGRPYTYRTRQGLKSYGDVEPDVFGPGIGMDVYGRPVKKSPF